MINSIVPIGCFAINHEAGSLIYRHNYEMLMDLSDDTLKASVDLCLTAALNTVTQFSYLLVEVNEGERKAQGVFDVLVP
ncbi:MAG: hypothetical protein IJT32_03675 [Lachnospiraceae bacterium]|nr:hypothetical protein [Lachnospiraceae bacterium]